MILIGTTTISLKRTTGSFFCPLCNDQRPYVKKAKKRFLTLYFIPVFPLANEGEFVQCSGCQKQFETDVLSFNPAQQEARRRSQAVAHVFRTMILVMIADGTLMANSGEQLLVFR